MNGADLVLLAGAGAGALLLVVAGLGHLRDHRMLAATLAAQRTLPHRVQPLVARATGPTELLLGLAALAGVVHPARAGRLALLGSGALYLVLSGYVARVWRTRPGAPCGCFGGSTPASGATVVRAALLAALALAVGLGAAAAPADAGELALVLGAAAVLAGAFWLVPELAGL